MFARKTSRSTGLLPFFVFLGGCVAAGRPLSASSSASLPADPTPRAAVRQKAEEAAIATALEKIALNSSEYRISAADLLEITIYQNKDLDRQVRVSQNGTISFPLAGTVQIGGLSVIDAERALSARLREYLVSPQVSIFIKEYGNKKVYVLGEVAKPGSYELPTESPLTVLEAISLAGGFTQVAAADRTKVIRTVDGKSQSIVVEVSAITKRGEKSKDLPLQPNDVVYVPQSFF